MYYKIVQMVYESCIRAFYCHGCVFVHDDDDIDITVKIANVNLISF